MAFQGETFTFDTVVTQLSGSATEFWSLGSRNRLFVYGGAGGSFDDAPLPTTQFNLGAPFRLGATRLPDVLGGPVFAGAWLENGDAFDEWSRAGWRSNGGVGLIMDTIVGPVILGGNWSFDGRWRTYLGVGRVFR
ncbi:MAG: hypothetical protein ABIX28_03675 [Vicinamibacterales bacterium]